jgi:hypothetical protein
MISLLIESISALIQKLANPSQDSITCGGIQVTCDWNTTVDKEINQPTPG